MCPAVAVSWCHKSGPRLLCSDLVDRGYASLEVALYVFALKVLAPADVHLVRGNHELKGVNARYGFKDDMVALFGPTRGLDVWDRIGSVFDLLPLAAVIDATIFCAHGGIPRAPAQGPDDRLEILHDTQRWKAFQESLDQSAMLEDPGFERYAQVPRRRVGNPPPPLYNVAPGRWPG